MSTPAIMPGFTAEHTLGHASHPYGYSSRTNQFDSKGDTAMEPQQGTGHVTNDVQTDVVPSAAHSTDRLISQQATQPCPTCGGPVNLNPGGGLVPSFVYALGRIEARFPSIGVEKEFAQTAGRAESTGLTDRQTLHEVLKQHRYLIR